MLTRSKSSKLNKSEEKKSKGSTNTVSVKKVIKKKSAPTSRTTPVEDFETRFRKSKGKCVAKIPISKHERRSLTNWFQLMMDAYPEDELKNFYQDYLGSAAVNENGEIDLAACVQISDENDAKWEKSILDTFSKDANEKQLESPKLGKIPYAAAAFFSCKLGSKIDCEKLVTFHEMNCMLTSVTRYDVQHDFVDLSTDENTGNIELFIQ
jgi:hypothetical protein